MIPGSANPLLLASAAAAGGYQIERSLRFNSSDSAYLSRTPAVAGNRRTFTLSWWIKKSGLTTFQSLFNSFTDTNNRTAINFDSSIGAGAPGDYLTMFNVTGATTTNIFQTNALFRDASAWYHIVVATDTTQATSTDRVKLWVNNTLQTFSTYNAPSQNADLNWNSATTHYYGVYGGSPSTTAYGFNGYLAECYLIDGQALTPSSFTEVSATTGQLIPKAYSGTFGTNGFWLKFSDNSAATAATLGKDYSPNGNNWTPNNLSVTAGAGNDSLVDTPTSYGTDTGVGGSVRGNYCTWNALDNAGTLANGNLDFSQASAAFRNVRSTFGLSSGKWYWEATLSAIGGAAYIGIGKATASLTVNIGGTDTFGYVNDGTKQSNNTSAVSYGASYTTGDVIGVAFDADNGTLTFYKNGTSQGQAYSGLTSGPYFMMVTGYNGTTWATNFGQRAFAYQTPGTNRPAATFLALCDTNLGAPVVAKPNTVMDVALFTGNGSSQNVTGLNFAPDFVWAKKRSAADSHLLFDVIRGATVFLGSDTTNGDQTLSSGLTAFNSDGFSWGSYGNGATFVGWAWDAGTTTASNGSGSITSQVRANVSAGFSVVTYTTPGSLPGTIGHGLNSEPYMIFTKSRGTAGGWGVYHKSIGNTNLLLLNGTNAAFSGPNQWNSTTPTSSVFSIGTDYATSATYVAYVFSPVVGYSSFGSYVGNGSSDGSFVYTGFRPRWILVKASSFTQGWALFDTARSTYNASSMVFLQPNTSNSEFTTDIDILSNGFKARANDGNMNGSGQTYIYAAFAENPFQYARAR